MKKSTPTKPAKPYAVTIAATGKSTDYATIEEVRLAVAACAATPDDVASGRVKVTHRGQRMYL